MSKEDWNERSGAVRDRHDASRAHNLAAHGAGALPRQPGADAVIAEEVAACQLYWCPHLILRHTDAQKLRAEDAILAAWLESHVNRQ